MCKQSPSKIIVWKDYYFFKIKIVEFDVTNIINFSGFYQKIRAMYKSTVNIQNIIFEIVFNNNIVNIDNGGVKLPPIPNQNIFNQNPHKIEIYKKCIEKNI